MPGQPAQSKPKGPEFLPSPQVLARRLGDVTVLLHLQADRFFQLNETAGRFWELLASGTAIAAIQQEMLREFDVPPAKLAAEMDTVLEMLLKERLLCSPAPASP